MDMRLKNSLQKMLQHIQIETTYFSLHKAVFYVLLAESELIWHLIDDSNDYLRNCDINELVHTGTSPQHSKIELKTSIFYREDVYIRLGVYREGSAPDVSQKAIDNAFLEGIKQMIQFNLELQEKNLIQERLLQISEKLHATFEVEAVFEIIYTSLTEYYPDDEVLLWLAQDSNYSPSSAVRSLDVTKNDVNTQAFILGQTLSYQLDESRIAISAPLIGKQGTYGTLQVISLNMNLTSKELEAITVMAETAGAALENAKLYQESQRLIHQLKLINEMTEQLSKSLNLENNIDFMLSKIVATFKPEGVHFAGYIKNTKSYKMLDSSTPSLENQIIEFQDQSFLQQIHTTKEPLIVFDALEVGKGIFNSEISLDPITYRSLLMVPMFNHQKIIGVLIVTHSEVARYQYDDFKLLQTLVHHASFSFVNSSLHEEVNRMVITDSLTRLYARNHLDQEILLSQAKDNCGSFILIDIDNFKKINDTYGHQVGDDILIQVANIMKSNSRDSDIVARWGGEELAIYLPNQLESVTQVAERIRERVSRETSPKVTISCGVSYWKKEDKVKTVESLFQKADRSLYKAKESGKNQVIVDL